MAFAADEIEDGTGKSTAIVYSTIGDPLAECLAYLIRKAGKTALAAVTGSLDVGGPNETPKQEMHVIRGTRYVEQLAQGRVVGTPRVSGQSLLQPRYGQYLDGVLIDSDTLPMRWLEACWEASELSASGENLFSVADDSRMVKREKTGASLETEWFQGSSSELKIYRSVEVLLFPLLEPLGRLQRG